MQHSIAKKRKQIETWMWGKEKDGPGRKKKCEKSLSLSQGETWGSRWPMGASVWARAFGTHGRHVRKTHQVSDG